MAIGKHISLEEARRKNKIDRFIKEHPLNGDMKKFKKLLNAMSQTLPKDKKTSKKG